MNRNFLTYLFILIVTLSMSFATIYVDNDLKDSYFTENNELIQSGSISGVNAIGYVCSNADCSQVAQQIFDGSILSSSGTSLRTAFENEALYLNNYGYGIYFYKDGYIPYEQRIRIDAQGFVGDYVSPDRAQVDMSRLSICRSVIDDFDVTNSVYPNQPIMIDLVTNLNANAYSPIQSAGPNDYVPSQIRRQYQVEIQVSLDIIDDNGQVVDQQIQNVYVDFSGNKEVRFEYVPTTTGRYTARVSTSANDGKCIESESHMSQKDFTVINQGPTQMCYSLLQNLQVSPQYPVENDQVSITIDKISNYYDDFGNLNPLASDIELIIKKDGQTVYEQTKSVSKNQNILDYKSVSFSYTPTEEGYYTVSVNADASSCPYNTEENDFSSQTIYVKGETVVPVDPNKAPVWVAIPTITLYEGESDSLQLTNYVTDPDGDGISISLTSQSDVNKASCSLSNAGNLNCAAISQGTNVVTVVANDGEDTTSTSVSVVILRPNSAPILSSLPDQLFTPGVTTIDNIFDLDAYASDIDGDSLSYTIVTNTNAAFDCSIDSQNFIDCSVSTTEGFTDLTVVVTDGDLQDSDVVRFSIDQIPVNQAPSANFPNVVLFENSGLNVDIFTVSDYLSDPENDVLSVQFVSESRKDIVDCTIHTNRLDCNVKDNMVGVSVVTLSISDGTNQITDSFTVTVENTPNNALIIANIPDIDLNENSGMNTAIIDLSNYASDVDGDSLTYTIFSESDTSIVDCSLSGSIVSCQVMPNQIGFSTVRIQVSDGQELDTDSFIVYVNQVIIPNTAPVIANIPDVVLVENSGVNSAILDLSNYASDVDGDSLTYTIFSESDTSVVDCSLSGSIVSCTVVANRIGDSTVRIEVSDGQDIDTDSFVVSVIEDTTQNTAPVIANIPDVVLVENSGVNSAILDLSNYASDVDGDSLTYTIFSESDTSIVDCSLSGSIVSCTVVANRIGDSTVRIEVSDGQDIDTDSFVVSVIEDTTQNTAPVIANIPDVTLDENSGLNSAVLDLSNYASDVDGDSLTYTITSESSRSIVDCSLIGSVISCTVAQNQIGVSYVTVQVSDGQEIDTDLFAVTVREVTIPNNAPTANFADVVLDANSGLNENIFIFDDFANDVDGDVLSYTITSESGLGIVNCDIVQGELDCTVVAGVNGSSTVTVLVSDGIDSVTDSFEVSIRGHATNGAPSLTINSLDVGRNSQTSIDLTSVTVDPDGDTVTYMIVSQTQPDIVECTLNNNNLVCVAQFNRVGESIITIKMTDGFVTVYETVRVVVLDVAHVHTSTPRVDEYLAFAQVKHPSVVDVNSADIPINMVLRNGGDVDLTNVRVSVMIPELGTKRTFGPFDLDEDDSESRSVVLPLYYQPEPGYYMIRFSVTSKEGEDRIMYREVLFK